VVRGNAFNNKLTSRSSIKKRGGLSATSSDKQQHGEDYKHTRRVIQSGKNIQKSIVKIGRILITKPATSRRGTAPWHDHSGSGYWGPTRRETLRGGTGGETQQKERPVLTQVAGTYVEKRARNAPGIRAASFKKAAQAGGGELSLKEPDKKCTKTRGLQPGTPIRGIFFYLNKDITQRKRDWQASWPSFLHRQRADVW